MNLTSRAALLFSTAFAVSGVLAAETFPSTYQVPANAPLLIQGATVLTGTGERLDGADVLISNGKIQSVGKGLTAPADARVIDAHGKWVTPGIIDIHSHLGVYASPAVKGLDDGNEMTNPVTANVWAEHSVWPEDPGFEMALEGGVTTLQILPGSANLIGGRSVVLKNVQSVTYQGMKFPGAAYGLKMACGENPKRVYGSRNQAPSTRMGNVAGYRQAFADAQDYQNQWDKYHRELGAYNKKKAEHTDGDAKKSKDKDKDGATDKEAMPPTPPKRDLKLETLAEVLKGNIRVHMHCYRADEMAQMIDVSHEFGYQIRAFHHAIEAYKIADLLAKNGIAAAEWADWGGFKMESFDAIRTNLALTDRAGVKAMIHSDDPLGVQRLNQEVAKAMRAGAGAGIPVTEEQAVKWMTINPAWALGLDDKIGSLEAGKNADVVLWSGDPFSVYAHADKVWIDGALLYDRGDPSQRWRTDFELGYVPADTALATGGAPR